MGNPYEGDSTTAMPGLIGRNSAPSGGNGIGVQGASLNGEGVHGETSSTTFAAVAGIELNAASNVAAMYGEQRGNGAGVFGIAKGAGPGVFGTSNTGEGVHGETNSTTFAAVAGIELNAASNVAAMYGEQRGNGAGVFGIAKGAGPGVFGTSNTGEGVHGETNSTTFAAVAGIELNAASNVAAVYGEQRGNGAGVFGIAKGAGPGVFGTSNTGEGVHGETNSASVAAVAGITLNPKATGAGIYGESRGQNPAGFFKGNVVVTGDISLINADCAEEFEIAAGEVEPGTVMALGPAGTLVPSQEAYSKKAVGIISGAGGYKPAIVLDRQGSGSGRAPIALMGKVCMKVDARYGAVQPGDLLTSSPTPGHAMRASDPLRAFGSVIGKSLGTMTSGRGTVLALVVRH